MTPWDISIFACLAVSFFATTLVLRRALTPVAETGAKLTLRPGETFGSRSSIKSDASLLMRFDHWIERNIYRSGIGLTPIAFMLANAAVAIALGGLMWVFEVNEGLIALATIGVFLLGFVAIKLAVKRRLKKFSQNFSSALELLARSVKAGESLEGSIELTSQTCQEPVKQELGLCAKQLRMGLSVSEVMTGLAERVPTMDARIFAHTISIHRETGGRLSDTLQRLANVIRQRTDYLEKIRTMTALGRFAALAIGYMGVFVLVYLSIFHPVYLQKLWSEPLGQKLAIYAGISEFIGIVWVALTLNSEE